MGFFAAAATAIGIVSSILYIVDTIRDVVKSTTDGDETSTDNTDKLNKDNLDKQRNFANVNRSFRGGAANNIRSTRGGVLSFLGDRSRRLDDAPDIVEENQSVLSGVSTLGGFFPFLNTRQPDIDNQRIVEAGFLGVRLEIDKINRNIDAIARAMAESAFIEEKYRKDMIDAMRRDLVEKGKDRSETRSERSIFNLITRPVKQAKVNMGKFKNDFAKAMLLSAGLEAANIFLPDNIGEDNNSKKEESSEDPPGSSDSSGDQPKVGDFYRGKDRKYYVLQPDGSFKKTSHVKPKEGKQFNKEDFNPVIESIKNNENNNLEAGFFSEDDMSDSEVKRLIELENQGIYGDDAMKIINQERNLITGNNLTYDNNIFNSGTPVAMNVGGLEGGEKVTFIDMRRKINDSAQGSDVSGADSELVDNIPEFDPARSSIYEAFVSV